MGINGKDSIKQFNMLKGEICKSEENMEEKRKMQLDEITIMRPILICIFLVGYHSFAPWGGVWEMPEAIKGEDVPTYFWLDKFLYSFMLETFTFVSGYIFAFQLIEQKREYTIGNLAWGKFKRLVVPCLLFSALYSFLCYNWDGWWKYVYDIICGLGHLWFLPMLFWCFILTFYIEKIKMNYWIKLAALLALSFISNGYGNDMPLRLGYVCYYLFFFYLAFGIFKCKEIILHRIAMTRKAWLVFILFVITFVFLTLITYFPSSPLSVSIGHYGYKVICHISSIVYSSLGLMSFYLLVIRYVFNGFKPPKITLCLNPLCMGIYILHNFVLSLIYEKTILPSILGTYLLPWSSYVFALTGGIIGTFLLRKTKVGKAIC